MQQTEQYQFNLIENSDHFSPEPINDNTCKFEAALCGLTRAQCFTYTGTGAKTNTLTFDVLPAAIILCCSNQAVGHAILFQQTSVARSTTRQNQNHDFYVSWSDNSVTLSPCFSTMSGLEEIVFNSASYTYLIIALFGEALPFPTPTGE